MGISERKEKEKNKMRKKIINASIKLFVKEGYENTSMRRIAKEIEYSPTTIYLYFKNKTELFYHVHEYLFEQLYNQLTSKTDFNSSKDKLLFIARTHIDFAINNPESYRLILVIKTPSDKIDNENEWNFGMKCLMKIEDAVSDLQNDLGINNYPIESLTFSFISFIHGISSFAIQQRLSEEYNAKIEELISNALLLLKALVYNSDDKLNKPVRL